MAKKNPEKSDLKALEKALAFESENIWEKISPADRKAIEAMAGGYLEFLSQAKTERLVAQKLISKVKAAGFTDLAKPGPAKNGGWLLHHGKLLGLYRPGRKSPAEGFNLIVAHGDCPRLDLKPKCVFEGCGLGLLKTNMYGGLKKFQWVTRPLALWGFCALADGRQVDIKFGEDPADPVLTVADILPHLDRKVQRDKKISEAIPAEKLNLLSASIPLGGPDDKKRLKLAILKILNDRWGIVEEDLVSSEIEIVPAGPARSVGLDGSMIGGYGQDDRLSSFAAAQAILEGPKPERPALVIIYDREEIGSYGSTGASGNFVEHLAARAFEAAGLAPDWLAVKKALMKSRALSADVEAAIDPDYKEVHEEMNAAHLGHGPCLVRYTGGASKYGASEAGAEYMALLRGAFAKAGVMWQNSLTGKQEEGGGGTVALYLAYYGMNIVDCGAPLLSMHSPFEISSKADVWMTGRAYQAFLNS